MPTNFLRLAPFIQEYIYQKRWPGLRPVQEAAIGAILDTSHHVLIASSTASGKTEAAMLPILTLLDKNPSNTIGVIYIGPLKALINDQFARLQELLAETGIPVQSWHGDIAQSKKVRFAKEAQGILQITPESLEAILINRHTEIERLFGDLRFVVIDEVHAFLDSDRGRQVLCQLQRLARYQKSPARRIGLSATLNEMEMVQAWLAGGTDVPVELVNQPQSGRQLELGLECFWEPPQEQREGVPETETTENESTFDLEPLRDDARLLEQVEQVEQERNVPDPTAIYQHIYQLTQSTKKTLIFANSRNGTEHVISQLRTLASERGTHDIYHVHHGNIATPRREAAEAAMRDPEFRACTAATLTLELGIDIGQLDQVLQIDATNSVASFVQRLGRAGRRGDAARMFFYNQIKATDGKRSVGEMMPWRLLQTIAIIQLYVEGQWVEPASLASYPFSLLYHQTMSELRATTELTPAQLAARVLSMSPFSAISQDDYRLLLRYLLEIEHLTLMENGTLIIGIQAEKIVNNYRFYATFEDQPLFQVLAKSREIGTIHTAPLVGSTIGLAGYTWRVLEIKADQRTVFVEPAHGEAKYHWSGGFFNIHTRILQRMKQLLLDDEIYRYLQKNAIDQLNWARQLARETEMCQTSLLPISERRYLVVPWIGSRAFTAQLMLLEQSGIAIKRDDSPYYYEIVSSIALHELSEQFKHIASLEVDYHLLTKEIPRHKIELNKYDRYIPFNLLQQAFVTDYLDIDGARASLHQIGSSLEVHAG